MFNLNFILKEKLINNQILTYEDQYQIISQSQLFNNDYYLNNNIDVKDNNIDPLQHFIKNGYKENRNPNQFFNIKDYKFINKLNEDVNPLIYYIKQKVLEQCKKENSIFIIKNIIENQIYSDNKNLLQISISGDTNISSVINNNINLVLNNISSTINKLVNNLEQIKLKVALCIIAKFENKYIKEFIEYYKELGIDKIYLYDTNPPNTENFHDVIGNYIDSGFVQHIIFNKGHQITQEVLEAYNDCYLNHKDEYDWICFFDPDEYLEFTKSTNIKQYLSQNIFDSCQIIHINWRIYDDNDLIKYDDRNLNIRFTRECKNQNSKIENEHIKSIVRGGLNNIIFNSPHTPILSDNKDLIVYNNCGINVTNTFKNPIDYKLAYLKHFRCKTISEYVNNKLPKLSLTGYQNIDFNDDFFFSINKWTKEKQDIYDNFIRKIIQKDYNSFRSQKKYKYSILTVITGRNEYDKLYDFYDKDLNIQKICITDRINMYSQTWQINNIKMNLNGEIEKWKFPKFHPFKFVDSEICIYVDGTVKILNSLDFLVESFLNSNCSIGLMIHPERCSVQAELDRWVKTRDFDSQKAQEILKFYEDQSFNIKALFFCSMMIFKKCEKTQKILDLEWELLQKFGTNDDVCRSDQIFMPYAVHKVLGNTVFDDVFMMSPLLMNSQLFERYHRTTSKKVSMPTNKNYLCFDKLVIPFKI